MRACWLKWVGRDWSISADYIWLNYSGANTGAVMCEQDEIWQESRYFSEVRMNELYDDGRTRGIDGPVEWARLEAEARKMLESGLELADRVEAA